jgi:hypothetical protein
VSRYLVVAMVAGLLHVSVTLHGESLHAASARPPVRSISVRVYDAEHVSAASLRHARQISQTIFQSAGVDVTWIMCVPGEGRSRDSRCDTGLAAAEPGVRIIRAPLSPKPGRVLGCAHVDRDTRVGALASIFADKVAATAFRLGLDASTLLGRVIAHEIGHLLGMSEHSTTGLMREHWSDDALRLGADRDFLFGSEHAPMLQEGVAIRTLLAQP